MKQFFCIECAQFFDCDDDAVEDDGGEGVCDPCWKRFWTEEIKPWLDEGKKRRERERTAVNA